MVKQKFGKPQYSFGERVLYIALHIPKGKIMTYGDIARAAGGGPMASQSVTAILSRAQKSGVGEIPFHRIVYANGSIWVDDRHREERLARYAEEGILIDARDRIRNFEMHRYNPAREARSRV